MRSCTLTLTNSFGANYGEYFFSVCRGTLNPTFASCLIDLYKRGGQEIENARLSHDGLTLCQKRTNPELNSCIIQRYGQALQALSRC